MQSEIDNVEKGDDSRTMMHADVANEVIDALNLLLGLTVTPDGAGKLMLSDGNAVLALDLSNILKPPPTGNHVLTAQDGSLVWEEIGDC